jgi:hypothetical protein
MLFYLDLGISFLCSSTNFLAFSAAYGNAQGRRKLDHIIRGTSQAFAYHLSQVLEDMVPDLHVLRGKLEKSLLIQLIEAAVGQAAHRGRTSFLIEDDQFTENRSIPIR